MRLSGEAVKTARILMHELHEIEHAQIAFACDERKWVEYRIVYYTVCINIFIRYHNALTSLNPLQSSIMVFYGRLNGLDFGLLRFCISR